MNYIPVGTQIDVIRSEASTLVVIGGAGTGKTITAAAAATEHLQTADAAREASRRATKGTGAPAERRTKERVLFLSFSRTAVAQVIERAGLVAGELMPRIEVSTFDGFAWRVLSDFGAHYGHLLPLSIVSVADGKIPGGTSAGFTYVDLIPAAAELLRLPTVGDFYSRRYGLIICDELQDTSDREWEFLQLVAPGARRIYLGDVNQCIYAGMKHIDPVQRMDAALSLPGAVRVDLPPASHRDPTGVLPAAAEAARSRRFDDEAIVVAVCTGRLILHRATGGGYGDVEDITKAARERRRTVSIFTHTNEATTALSDALSSAGIMHEQVGFGEAHAEAVKAQRALLRWALLHEQGARRALAVYVAATSRGPKAPPLAFQILDKSNAAFERALRAVGSDLLHAAAIPDYAQLAETITSTWARLGTSRGQETWCQAARHTRAALWRVSDGTADVDTVGAVLDQAHDLALLNNTGVRPHVVQVMNLHQTKGREADVTVLLLQPGEYYGNESEPYAEGSRLLYVVMTRARLEANLIVPPQAHPLWQPLVDACERASGQRS